MREKWERNGRKKEIGPMIIAERKVPAIVKTMMGVKFS